MLIGQDPAIIEKGAAAQGVGGDQAPEIRVSAADAPAGGARPHEETSGGGSRRNAAFLARAAGSGGAVAVYLLAAFIGWRLYDVMGPIRLAWPDFTAGATRPGPAEGPSVAEKLAADMEVLRARLDAIEKARGREAKILASIDQTDRRLDELKAGLDARFDALAGQMRELRHEAGARQETDRAQETDRGQEREPGEARREEPRPVMDPAERRSEQGRGRTQRAATVAAHVEPGWRRAHRRGDAFDPASHPNAPGAPRPLGAPFAREQ